MNNIDLLKGFAKGTDSNIKTIGQNAVIYTRVSSKEQMDNMSLETQLKGCNLYAQKFNYTICEYFGGTYESAQSDERKEFVRMINFVKKSKVKISYIIVYSLERFSRTGDNAIWLSRQLRELGISIISVTQPIDTTNPSGVLQQNILFLFSQYDNDLRRQKTVAGIKEKLLKGEWIGSTPIGYAYDRTGDRKEQKIIITDKGKFIKLAFEWKANEKISNIEIKERLKRMGFSIPRQTLTDILRNPFYCGYISHNLLEGQLVKGKHPALISEELFLRTHDVMKKITTGFKQRQHDEKLPLKRFIHCADCNTPFTGYQATKKKLKVKPYYYKCNKPECKCNRSAVEMHEKFKTLLRSLQIDSAFIAPLKDQLEYTYEFLAASSIEEKKALKQRFAELESKINTIEERFALGEIDRGIYEKVHAKLKQEISPIKEDLEKLGTKLSNPSKMVSKALNMCANLQNLWELESFQGKQKLQNAIFPDGIIYDKKTDYYRTPKVNIIIEISKYYTENYKNGKADVTTLLSNYDGLVPRAEVEPIHFTTF